MHLLSKNVERVPDKLQLAEVKLMQLLELWMGVALSAALQWVHVHRADARGVQGTRHSWLQHYHQHKPKHMGVGVDARVCAPAVCTSHMVGTNLFRGSDGVVQQWPLVVVDLKWHTQCRQGGQDVTVGEWWWALPIGFGFLFQLMPSMRWCRRQRERDVAIHKAGHLNIMTPSGLNDL